MSFTPDVPAGSDNADRDYNATSTSNSDDLPPPPPDPPGYAPVTVPGQHAPPQQQQQQDKQQMFAENPEYFDGPCPSAPGSVAPAAALTTGSGDYYNTTDDVAIVSPKQSAPNSVLSAERPHHGAAAAAQLNTSRTNPSVKYVA